MGGPHQEMLCPTSYLKDFAASHAIDGRFCPAVPLEIRWSHLPEVLLQAALTGLFSRTGDEITGATSTSCLLRGMASGDRNLSAAAEKAALVAPPPASTWIGSANSSTSTP